MSEQNALILHLVSGERIIGECKDNGLFWELKDVFIMQEMFVETDEEDTIMSQLSLTSFTAYSHDNSVSIPKQFVICAMAPNEYIKEIHADEIKSLKEQMDARKEKDKPKASPSGNVTQFKKRH